MSHALLSPSAAHRWMNCTMSPHLEKDFPDEETPYILEGSLAHAYCSLRLKEKNGIPSLSELPYIEEHKEYETDEMHEHVETYVNIVLGKLEEARETTSDARLLVERGLMLDEYIPKGYGTADAIIIADDCMEVIDFKYGKGVPVSAVDNEQMMIYALGAYLEYTMEYDVKRVRMTIVQPRCNNLSTHELSIDELTEWADTVLRPTATVAYAAKGVTKVGPWCRFCRAKAVCRQLADDSRDAVEAYQDPYKLTPEELAKNVLPLLDSVSMWVKAVEAATLERAKSGEKFPGYKLVHSRGRRKVVDVEGMKMWLAEQHYDLTDYAEPAQLKPLTALEKLVGKKKFATECSAYVAKVEGSLKLVADTEAGEAIDPTADFD